MSLLVKYDLLSSGLFINNDKSIYGFQLGILLGWFYFELRKIYIRNPK
jgi:hypothetical protein